MISIARKCGICRKEGHDRRSCPTPNSKKNGKFFNNSRWNDGPLFVEVFWFLSILPLIPVIFVSVVVPPILVGLLMILFLYRICLIRIYGYFRPNWEETDPKGSVIIEALNDLTQPLDDFVDETREDVKDKITEFDENMSEHDWYRKNRIAIYITAVFALLVFLALLQGILTS